MMRRVWVFVLSLMLLPAAGMAILSAQPGGGTSAFQSADSLPPQDQIAAAPLLIAAYAFVLVALMVYVWLLWRRLAKVESEMHALAKRQGRKDA
jgi:CcmD family protein